MPGSLAARARDAAPRRKPHHSAREGYSERVTTRPDADGPQLAQLRTMLEHELDREARPYQGCWPLAIAVAGLLLALWLLVR
jgi:hypothetical protein